ncbi:hypothetical protein [Endozoicomonas sp. Mp262]|uniref:hypothetical protein n=1 Tax=Endozoicomonas sp. Mp262 TaxID=2919499 RepID=UPI0021DB311D
MRYAIFLALLAVTLDAIAVLSEYTTKEVDWTDPKQGFVRAFTLESDPGYLYILIEERTIGQLYGGQAVNIDGYTIFHANSKIGCIAKFLDDKYKLPFQMDNESISLSEDKPVKYLKKWLPYEFKFDDPVANFVIEVIVEKYYKDTDCLRNRLKEAERLCDEVFDWYKAEYNESKKKTIYIKELREKQKRLAEEIDRKESVILRHKSECHRLKRGNEELQKQNAVLHKECKKNMESKRVLTETVNDLSEQFVKISLRKQECEAELLVLNNRFDNINLKTDIDSDSGVLSDVIVCSLDIDDTGFDCKTKKHIKDNGVKSWLSQQPDERVLLKTDIQSSQDDELSCASTHRTSLKESEYQSLDKADKKNVKVNGNTRVPEKDRIKSKNNKKVKKTKKFKVSWGDREKNFEVEKLMEDIFDNDQPLENYQQLCTTSTMGWLLDKLIPVLCRAGCSTQKLAGYFGKASLYTVHQLSAVLNYLLANYYTKDTFIVMSQSKVISKLVRSFFLEPRNNPFIESNAYMLEMLSIVSMQALTQGCFGVRMNIERTAGFLIGYSICSLMFIYKYTTDPDVKDEVVKIFNDYLYPQELMRQVIHTGSIAILAASPVLFLKCARRGMNPPTGSLSLNNDAAPAKEQLPYWSGSRAVMLGGILCVCYIVFMNIIALLSAQG